MRWAAGIALATLCATGAERAEAQQGLRLTAAAGVSQFDLSGVGDAFTMAARVDGRATPWILWEVGVGVSFPGQQFGDTTTVVIPEAQVQVEWPRRLAPYLGVGAGVAFDLRPDDVGGTQTDPTFSGALGLRFAATDRIGLRAELRVRGIGTGFEGSAAEWTGGVGWRF